MLSVLCSFLGLCVPLIKRVDVQLACWQNILESPLTHTEREATLSRISNLMCYKYVLQNVQSARVRILPEELLCKPVEGEGGAWYLEEDF